MGFYFDSRNSMFGQAGMHIEATLEGVVRRYVGCNPAHPPTFRAYSRRGILRGKDYRYDADFNRFFPDAQAEQYVYAWAKYWTDRDAELMFDVSCFSPMVIYCNREVVFRSNIFTERYADQRTRLTIKVKAGWNHFIVRSKKTKAGFGGRFGTWLGKLPYYFIMPTKEREGQEGWIFTRPLSAELDSLPGPGMTEADTGLEWLPELTWSAEKRRVGQLNRIFGLVPGGYAVAWTKGLFLRPGKHAYTLKGEHRGSVQLLVNDTVVYEASKSGAVNAKIEVPFGDHDVMVKSGCNDAKDWGFTLSIVDTGTDVGLRSPSNTVGTTEPWIYIGPFAQDSRNLRDFRDLNRVFPALGGGKTYWRVDLPDAWLRPYNENPLYGRWNYPLGVTLYGLLHSAAAIGSSEVKDYIQGHIQYCCDTFEYALWDREQYGGATAVHHLLSSIDSLDDCGSFGSVVLEVARHAEIHGYRVISDYIADYIANKQVRLPDGTFFRKHLMHEFHEDTLWADDLYMSVPFLCRYYQLSGEQKYIDDAARQFLGFKKRLFIPEWKVMSHVYDFKRDMATGIPWGRGNGWVIFSLSELLAVLPANHALKPELLAMFRDLCEGYLALQDANGMWHQVLNHPDSYPETSCTSMFTYAFARGVQNGWFANNEPYIDAVFRAWEALNKTSIDRDGNVHGVCRGSEFSFTPEYYKKELLWNLNDTHGIGIVLLAGVEVLRLKKHLEKSAG
ncbi:rhamnogalacturonyl hydrolase [Opitutaceae bacterium EW11]|nr:rhamnogalacturonyl hydrolase [Opitutaceae bacterium EW11]